MGHNQNAQVKSMTVCRKGLCDISKDSLAHKMQSLWKKSAHHGSMKKVDRHSDWGKNTQTQI